LYVFVAYLPHYHFFAEKKLRTADGNSNAEGRAKLKKHLAIISNERRGNTIRLIHIAQILQTHCPILQIVALIQNHTHQWILARPVIIGVREEKDLRRISASPQRGRVNIQGVRERVEDPKGDLNGTMLITCIMSLLT